MSNLIPNSVIGAVASVISKHYYSHSKLETLFMESGASGDIPEGNCEKKCSAWLKRCNEDPAVDALNVLGCIIQEFMDKEPRPFYDEPDLKEGQNRIKNALAKNQLEYKMNGHIVMVGSSPITKTLEDFLKAGDFASIEKEFERAVEHINTDPHASITAACSIIEATCKTYIETHDIDMPKKQTVVPLWKYVQQHMGLNSDKLLGDDQWRLSQALSSIVDGVGAFRTHIGSAHGRGVQPPEIEVSDARLAVNSAHTLVVFILERWHSSNAQNKVKIDFL